MFYTNSYFKDGTLGVVNITPKETIYTFERFDHLDSVDSANQSDEYLAFILEFRSFVLNYEKYLIMDSRKKFYISGTLYKLVFVGDKLQDIIDNKITFKEANYRYGKMFFKKFPDRFFKAFMLSFALIDQKKLLYSTRDEFSELRQLVLGFDNKNVKFTEIDSVYDEIEESLLNIQYINRSRS